MLKKLTLALFLVNSLGLVSNVSAITNEATNFFNFGFEMGVNPLFWKFIPNFVVEKHENGTTYISKFAGLTMGVTVLALAVYGAKKLVEEQLGCDKKQQLI